MKNTAVLLLSTPVPLARKGAVAAIVQFLVTHNGSIPHARAVPGTWKIVFSSIRTRPSSSIRNPTQVSLDGVRRDRPGCLPSSTYVL